MTKLAQAVNEPVKENLQDSAAGTDKLNLKKKKEDEIRMQLDQFARELTQARRQRDDQ